MDGKAVDNPSRRVRWVRVDEDHSGPRLRDTLEGAIELAADLVDEDPNVPVGIFEIQSGGKSKTWGMVEVEVYGFEEQERDVIVWNPTEGDGWILRDLTRGPRE